MSITQERNFEQLNSKLPINMFVMKYLPDGKKKNNEWVSLNPTRQDSKPGSFSVNLNTGVWKEFAGDGDGGNDMISLYAYIKGCSQSQAYDELSQIYAHSMPIPKSNKPEKDEGIVIYPAPADAGTPAEDNRAMEFCYRNENNQVLLYVFRYNNPDGSRRLTPPCTYRLFKDGSKSWHKKGIDEHPKPLYHIPELLERPQARVILVEGEKAAEAAQRLMPDWVATCWHGGSNAANLVDYSYLKDRDVILWPDNDDPGFKAMKVALSKLKPIAKSVRSIDIRYLETKNPTWDLADGEAEGITYDEIMQLIDMQTETELTYPDLSNHTKPRPLDTADNYKALLKHFRIKNSWNMMKRIRTIEVPGIKFYGEESENAALNYITDLAVKNDLNIRRIDKHLDAIAWSNPFHPVRDWVLSKPLNQKNIFDDFLKCVQTTNNVLSYILIKRWMVSAITALFNDSDFCSQGVLVIQGEPGTHKSSFIMSLVPNELKAIKGGTSLDPSNKVDIFTLSAYWFAELGELDATFRKADIARLKSHITNDVDDVRRPHAVRNSQMTRRTVYAATVNDEKFLVDTTGNRRWWTISITEPIKTRHGLDMQQVWRAVYDMWLAGESPTLLEDEMKLLNESNKEFEYIDPFQEKLDAYFNWEWKDRLWMNSSQVLEKIGYTNINPSQATKMGRILSKRKMEKKMLQGVSYYNMPIFNINSGGHKVD